MNALTLRNLNNGMAKLLVVWLLHSCSPFVLEVSDSRAFCVCNIKATSNIG